MTVTRTPRDEAAPPAARPEDPAFPAYLRQGGRAAQAAPEAAPESTPKDVRFTLHLPGALCQELDRLRAARPLKISRHQWVLEAILEKTQREGGQGT
jgi:hypothetical protein